MGIDPYPIGVLGRKLQPFPDDKLGRRLHVFLLLVGDLSKGEQEGCQEEDPLQLRGQCRIGICLLRP